MSDVRRTLYLASGLEPLELLRKLPMAAFNDAEALRGVLLFEGLPPEQLSQLNALLHRKTFPARATVMMEEQPGEVAYVILSGSIKVSVAGDEIDTILALLGPGEVVGEMSLVDCLGRSATAQTQEECKMLWIDRQAFSECLLTMPQMAVNLVRVLTRRVRLANARIQSLATLDVDGRIARQLLAFAQEYGQVDGKKTTIPLRLTQSDLAGLVGASRESVNHAISGWKQSKLLSVDTHYHITLLDQPALARRCR